MRRIQSLAKRADRLKDEAENARREYEQALLISYPRVVRLLRMRREEFFWETLTRRSRESRRALGWHFANRRSGPCF